MILKILLLLLTIYLSQEHFMGNRLSCVESYTCLHDGKVVCSQHKGNKSYKWFMDLCELKEFNCDNDEEYITVAGTECAGLKLTLPLRRKEDNCATTEQYNSSLYFCTREQRTTTTPPPSTTTEATTQIVTTFVGMTVTVTCPYDVAVKVINETMIIILCKNTTKHATTVTVPANATVKTNDENLLRRAELMGTMATDPVKSISQPHLIEDNGKSSNSFTKFVEIFNELSTLSIKKSSTESAKGLTELEINTTRINKSGSQEISGILGTNIRPTSAMSNHITTISPYNESLRKTIPMTTISSLVRSQPTTLIILTENVIESESTQSYTTVKGEKVVKAVNKNKTQNKDSDTYSANNLGNYDSDSD